MQLPLPLIPTEPEVLAALATVFDSIKDLDNLLCNKEKILSFTPVGAGASRVVFDLGNGYVAKITRQPKWKKQSRAEWETWKKSKKVPGLRENLCPIVAHDVKKHRWTIMPKAERVGEVSWGAVDALRGSIGKLAPELGIGDFGPSNIGVHRGRTVLLDYGVSGGSGWREYR